MVTHRVTERKQPDVLKKIGIRRTDSGAIKCGWCAGRLPENIETGDTCPFCGVVIQK